MRQKDSVPRYEAPPKDPIESRLKRRFSVQPHVVDTIKSFKSRVAVERGMKDPFISAQDYRAILDPFTLSKKLGEEDREYRQRAVDSGVMTVDERDVLIQQEMGYIGTPDTKLVTAEHEKVLNEIRQRKEERPVGLEVEMNPYLVSLTWVYEGSYSQKGGRRSPPVKYSIEGVFYGEDMETTMEAAREFMMDVMSDSVSYKAKAIMDVADIEIDAKIATDSQIGAMEVSGESVKKRIGDEITDERFETRVHAFFQNPETGRVYADTEFGYRDSPIRYRWINGGTKIVSD